MKMWVSLGRQAQGLLTVLWLDARILTGVWWHLGPVGVEPHLAEGTCR